MLKRFYFIFLITIFIMSFGTVEVFATASNFKIDISQTSNGIVSVTGTPGAKTVKVQISKEGEKLKYNYVYSSTNQNIYPLQLGNGKYTITVLENKSGNEYMKLVSKTVNVTNISEKALYTSSIQLVDYKSSKDSIKEMKSLIASAKDENEKVLIIYDYLISHFDYDYEKANKITQGTTTDYLPVIDSVYSAKKGICYDYASVLAGVLRSAGIPTKLQMGYSSDIPNQYHAWNEIYVGGTWFKIDATYDTQVKKANLEVNVKKPDNKFTVLKYY